MKGLAKFKVGYWTIIAAALTAFIIGYLSKPTAPYHNQQTDAQNETTTWTCAMHPQIRQPQAGKCPICGMDLIPIAKEHTEELGMQQLYLSDTALKLANVQTAFVEYKAVSKSIALYGKIEVDETLLKSITAHVPGRIESLYVDYTGAAVKTGEPLLDIYSPDLYVAQQEYLNTLSNPNSALLDSESVRKKLRLWGLTDRQLEEIEKRGYASETMTVDASSDGIVMERHATRGAYVDTGTPLYDIADLSTVWIDLNAYEKDIAWLKLGQKITFTTEAYPGIVYNGTINFIDPVLDADSRTVKVRAVAANSDNRLVPGLLVSAHIAAGAAKRGLVIPATAPLLTGKRAIVYVALPEQKGTFEGREIVLGERVDDFYIVASGLRAGEQVVTNGAFKIDSEMQILAKKSMMNLDGGKPASLPHDHRSTDFVNSLADVFLAYFDIQDALAHDNVNAVTQPAARLLTSLQKVDAVSLSAHYAHWQRLGASIQNTTELIASTNDIAIVRAKFFKLSEALIETLTAFGAPDISPIRQYHCPMAFNNKGADWLSQKDKVENPYFGAEMFSCGSPVKIFANKKGDDE
ncbi:efflux RND transporter periplasmic adaptor subunit [candidate division KSB1 bacterium]|nr:efflux RND transporter periplasmic adaptor subunit [candidate division KSB1 bacterium]